MPKTTYLIFGNGFIASHYANFLLNRREGVRVIYRNKMNPDLPSSIQERSGGSIKEIKKILLKHQPKFVIIAQGVSFIPDTEKNLEESISGNLVAPLKILEALYILKKSDTNYDLPKKILTFGSSAEYGENEGKASREDSKANPSSLYGLSKSWLHQIAKYYVGLGLPCVHLRQFNAIGTGQNPSFALSSFCRQAVLIEKGKQSPHMKVGNLTQKRDFIDIRDAVAAYDTVLKHAKPGQTVNICTGKSHLISAIINEIKKISKVRFDIKINSHLMGDRRTRDNVVIGNPALLRKWGWKQKYSIQDSLQWILEYWRKAL